MKVLGTVSSITVLRLWSLLFHLGNQVTKTVDLCRDITIVLFCLKNRHIMENNPKQSMGVIATITQTIPSEFFLSTLYMALENLQKQENPAALMLYGSTLCTKRQSVQGLSVSGIYGMRKKHTQYSTVIRIPFLLLISRWSMRFTVRELLGSVQYSSLLLLLSSSYTLRSIVQQLPVANIAPSWSKAVKIRLPDCFLIIKMEKNVLQRKLVIGLSMKFLHYPSLMKCTNFLGHTERVPNFEEAASETRNLLEEPAELSLPRIHLLLKAGTSQLVAYVSDTGHPLFQICWNVAKHIQAKIWLDHGNNLLLSSRSYCKTYLKINTEQNPM